MNILLPFLIVLSGCVAKGAAPEKGISSRYYVVSSNWGEYRNGSLRFYGIESEVSIHDDNERGSTTFTLFIDEKQYGEKGVLVIHDHRFPLKIKSLRYNPYNHWLTLELEDSPFKKPLRFGKSTLYL
ncbi:MAG: hypothetical protein S4CHLAM45_00720 [Chlamydiales bacterium]|nr:hypothetical protein [Chlamydiales bacterium]MCH9619393.1 hypothetical protein [Chlamydiales bacterium]MCH9622197.1 hypothetical protein [Chlamydiales bacterium]